MRKPPTESPAPSEPALAQDFLSTIHAGCPESVCCAHGQLLLPFASAQVFDCLRALKTAKLNYTTDTGLRSKRQWISIPATIDGTTITAPKPPRERQHLVHHHL